MQTEYVNTGKGAVRVYVGGTSRAPCDSFTILPNDDDDDDDEVFLTIRLSCRAVSPIPDASEERAD